MNFLLALICILAGFGIGLGISQSITSYLISENTNRINNQWIEALSELNKIDVVTNNDDVQVFENVTVMIKSTNTDNDDISWYRQENTKEISYEEFLFKNNK